MEEVKEYLTGLDLEGPVSFEDHAALTFKKQLTHLLGSDDSIGLFKMLSDWIYWLVQARVNGFVYGDTLRYAVPLLLHAGTTNNDLERASKDMTNLAHGVPEFIQSLLGWANVHILTVSYEQHALSIADRIGLCRDNVSYTPLNIDRIREQVGALRWVDGFIANFRSLNVGRPDPDAREQLMWSLVRGVNDNQQMSHAMHHVRTMGGIRKLRRLEELRLKLGIPWERVAAVADSVTDLDMLFAVRERGGLAIAVNATLHALERANCAVAGINATATIQPLLEVWREGGIRAVREFVEASSQLSLREFRMQPNIPQFHWIPSTSSLATVVDIHNMARGVHRHGVMGAIL